MSCSNPKRWASWDQLLVAAAVAGVVAYAFGRKKKPPKPYIPT